VASRIASWQEVETLASVLKDSRRGIFQLAGLTDRIGIPGIVDHQGGNRDKFMALIVKLGLPAAFGFFLLAGSADWDEAVELLDEANNRGARLVAMYHCRPFCHAFSFGTRLPFDDLPEWRSFRALDLAQQKERLLDPEVRNRLVRSVANSELDLNYDDIFVMESGLPPHRSVMSIAKELGSDPVQVILQLVAETDFERVFLIVRGNRCEADLLRVMAHPMTRMTFSDSGAHVQKIMDACIQTYLLAWWVREKQALPLEKAVRMITRDIADSWGLRDRGLLKVGMKADLNIFDQERIQPRVPRVAHDLPGGSPRLVQQCDGIRATVVNGRVILRDGEATGLLPGSVVRDGGRWTA
jgi:N-acyl-D-amino-acid deacylase